MATIAEDISSAFTAVVYTAKCDASKSELIFFPVTCNMKG